MQYKYDHKVMNVAKWQSRSEAPLWPSAFSFLSKSTPNTDTLCFRKDIQSSWKMWLGAKRLWNLGAFVLVLIFTLQCPFLAIFCACASISICVLRHMRHCWGCWRGIGGGTGDSSKEPGGAQRPRQQMWPTVECAVLRYGMVFLIWHGMIMVWLVLLDVSLHVWWSCKVAVWCTMYMDNMVW